MSFDIFWDKLDKQLAQKVQEIINEHFRTTNNKPSFIGDIEISDFDFGTVPPSVEIVDITEPFPEFYLPDNVVVEVDVRSDLAESRVVGGVGNGVRNGNGGIRAGVEEGRTRENVISNGQRISHNTSSSFPQPNPLHNNNNDKPPITPIITSAIASSTITPSSPSTISDTSADYLYHQRRQRFQNGEIPLNLKDYNRQIDEQSQFESLNSEEEEEVPLNQDADSQIHVSISYKGNMKMIISTELYMNYPSLMFMSLPVRLTITGFEFSATAVIAYIRNQVNFCFLEPKDSEESLLKDVHIESEIGDKEKQVLKNVGKLEKFIVDQLRKIIDEDFVFPSYYSIEL